MIAFIAALLLVASHADAQATDVSVAVTAEFAEPAKAIAAAFTHRSGHKLVLTFGTTRRLYAEIKKGAGHAVLLSSDPAIVRMAVADHAAVAQTSLTVARDRLVLFSRENNRVQGEVTLRNGAFSKLAIANPSFAPGAAAVQALQALGVYTSLRDRLVIANSAVQAYQLVATGNAELGLIAQSQLGVTAAGSRWLVPDQLHAPIAVDAVLLTRGADDPAARALMTFLRSSEARAIVVRFGYGVGE